MRRRIEAKPSDQGRSRMNRIALGAGAVVLGGVSAFFLPTLIQAPPSEGAKAAPVAVVDAPSKPRLASAPTDTAITNITESVIPTPATTPSPAPVDASHLPSKDDLARLAGIIRTFSRHDAMLKKLQSEPRDPVWAPKSEALLTERYSAMPHIGGAGRVLSIHCGSTLCMVTGDLPNGSLPDASRQAMDALHSYDMVKELWALGYGGGGSAYGPSASDNRGMFVTFYERTVPRKLRS